MEDQTPGASGAQDCDDHVSEAHWAYDKEGYCPQLELGGFADFLAEICCETLLHLLLCAIASLPVCDSRCSWLVDHRSGQAIAFDVWGSYVRPICKREGGGVGGRERERK